MKRNLLLFIMVFCMMFTFTSCKKHKKDVPAPQPAAELVVEHLISMDRETMNLKYANKYNWYETSVVLVNYLDEENNGEISGVSNIFQYAATNDDSNVVMFTHVKDTTAVEEHWGALWVGDMSLNNEEIKLTFKEAFDKLMQTNIVKPHSRQCVLRKELGPKPNVAPQYIFGNVKDRVYVDAKTGNVSKTNPVYEGFEKLQQTPTWP